jgi:4-hydroxy-tetrahydrodipicolinate synthase
VKGKLFGVIPPMTTPFDKNGDLIVSALLDQVDFLVDAGVHGIVAGGSNGEGHTFDRDSYAGLIEIASTAARGRVPFVAGVIVNSTREAIVRGQMLKGMDVAALQVTPVHYLFKPDDTATVEHFRAVAEETKLPILIYNVIPWNYLSPALLLRIMREVPGVVGVKQSAGDLKLLSDLLDAAQPDDLIFTAIDALLYSSYDLGAHGSIAAMLAAVPHANVALWDAVKAGDHDTARQLHRRLLRLWNAIVGDNLPACVKYAQTLQGCSAFLPRAPMSQPSERQKVAIRQALEGFSIKIKQDAA